MSPSSFTFKLTVPTDPELAALIAEMARHATGYANLNGEPADRFVERARAAAARSLQASSGPSCQAVFTAADGTLSMTLGSETVSQPLS